MPKSQFYWRDYCELDGYLRVHRDDVKAHLAIEESAERFSMDRELAYSNFRAYGERNNEMHFNIRRIIMERKFN